MIALDTNILIEIDSMNIKVIETLRQLRKKLPSNPVIPSPVVSEYYYGFLGTRKKESALKNIENYEVINTSKNSSLIFAEFKHATEKSGQVMPDMDILIASICVDNNATLVTLDKRFNQIKELNKIILELK